MTQRFDVLVAGEINPDLVLSGNVEPEFGQVEKMVGTAALTVGSSSAIFACGAARLGLKTAFIGKCGDDIFGRFMLEEMTKRGVNVEYVVCKPDGETGLSVILNRGIDRAILTHSGLISALSAEDVHDDLLGQTRHLHVASYFLQTSLRPGLPHLFERAHRMGCSTSLDPNYDPSEKWQGFDELLPLLNVFFPNGTEACSLAHQANPEQAADWLSTRVETLVIKLGPDGALAIRGGQKVLIPSIPIQFVDSVGAGDSFDAGFIYGYLNNWPLEKTLKLAIICGALSTQASGGTIGQASMKDVEPYDLG